MKRATWSGYCRAIAAAALSTLALIVAVPAARAEVRRAGSAPWYQQSTAAARQKAQALFEQAVDKHLQLSRGDALELYEQALALWDNPDIRWNLALLLEDLGKYLAAHQQLERALRWDAALGTERLREVRARMQVLETQRLARIEAVSEQAGADVRLDGQPWFGGAGRHSMLVTPGTHYIGATKPGYTPTTVSMVAAAGEQYRVTLRMVVDHIIETRRWPAWTPWSVVAAGTAVAAVGAGVEWQAHVQRAAAARAVVDSCHMGKECSPTHPPESDRAVINNWIAIGAFAAGGTAIAVGTMLAWLNQPRAHRPEATPSPIELIPSMSPNGAGVSARVRF
jgi:hypothetical protein